MTLPITKQDHDLDEETYQSLKKAVRDVLRSGSIARIYEAVGNAMEDEYESVNLESYFKKRLALAIEINENAQNEVDK